MKILEYLGFNKRKTALTGSSTQVAAYSLYKIGKRNNNEDYYYPKEVNSTSVFVVCDGVGGAAKGEIASQIAAETIHAHLSQCNGTQPQQDIQEAIDKAMLALYEHARKEPMSSGLGTTATLVWKHNGQAYLGHVGDSRIYFFRDGQQLFETKDHSMVNDLIASGIINEEQAKTHPRRNVITRALIGKHDGPDTPMKPVKVDIKIIPEIYEGDEILLCTDGILESFDSSELSAVVGLKNISTSEKIKLIEDKCAIHSKDNHTLTWLKITRS